MGAHLQGYSAAIFLEEATNFDIVGGLYESVGAGGEPPFYGDTGWTGTLNALTPPAVKNASSATQADTLNFGTGTFTGQLADPPSSSMPTTKCNIGQISVKAAAAGLWGCTAPNTWGSLY